MRISKIGKLIIRKPVHIYTLRAYTYWYPDHTKPVLFIDRHVYCDYGNSDREKISTYKHVLTIKVLVHRH